MALKFITQGRQLREAGADLMERLFQSFGVGGGQVVIKLAHLSRAPGLYLMQDAGRVIIIALRPVKEMEVVFNAHDVIDNEYGLSGQYPILCGEDQVSLAPFAVRLKICRNVQL